MVNSTTECNSFMGKHVESTQTSVYITTM